VQEKRTIKTNFSLNHLTDENKLSLASTFGLFNWATILNKIQVTRHCSI